MSFANNPTINNPTIANTTYPRFREAVRAGTLRALVEEYREHHLGHVLAQVVGYAILVSDYRTAKAVSRYRS